MRLASTTICKPEILPGALISLPSWIFSALCFFLKSLVNFKGWVCVLPQHHEKNIEQCRHQRVCHLAVLTYPSCSLFVRVIVAFLDGRVLSIPSFLGYRFLTFSLLKW